jgi:hypothetical protein
LCTCCRHYPISAAGRRRGSSHPAVSAFPDNVVGSACTSSFSRPAQRSLALRPAHSRRHLYVTCYTEGFSHFVTSMTTPVASGWSGCRVGLAPTGKRRLVTAHTSSGRCIAARKSDSHEGSPTSSQANWRPVEPVSPALRTENRLTFAIRGQANRAGYGARHFSVTSAVNLTAVAALKRGYVSAIAPQAQPLAQPELRIR